MGYVQLWQSPLQSDLDNPTGSAWVPSGFNRASTLANPIYPGMRCKLAITPVTEQSIRLVEAWVKVGGVLHPQILPPFIWNNSNYEAEFVANNHSGLLDITAVQVVVTFHHDMRPKNVPKAKLFVDYDFD